MIPEFKRPELEDKEKVIARIHEAAKYVPLDRLYLSPQCGFASCEIGNKLTEDEQWAKLALVKEIAEEVWGKLNRKANKREQQSVQSINCMLCCFLKFTNLHDFLI